MTAAIIPSFTKKELLAALKSASEEFPDKVYEAPRHMDPQDTGVCFYAHVDEQGEPTGAGCIVGEALHRLGVPLEVLRHVEGMNPYGVLRSLGLDFGISLADDLAEIQSQQDQGATWEAAYTDVFGLR